MRLAVVPASEFEALLATFGEFVAAGLYSGDAAGCASDLLVACGVPAGRMRVDDLTVAVEVCAIAAVELHRASAEGRG
jgi:hypothetical protein